MAIDQSKNVNSRPYVPGSGDTNIPPTAQVATGTTAPPSSGTMDPLPDGQQPSSNQTQPSLTNDDQAILDSTRDEALMQILDDPSYQVPNSLSALRQSTYKFRLFLTTEHEVVTGSGVGSISALYQTLDSIPQVTIAESGVTAGFNIKDAEIEQVCGPGWRNKSTQLTKLTMTIVEPKGSSLVEAMISASMSLGIRNFQKVWYYVELRFLGYDEDGSINLSPLEEMQLDNGGRWVYQVNINNMDIHMDETGATYKLECTPYNLNAFDDETAGRVIDKMNVSGTTIGDFLTDFTTKLTKSYKDRYLGEIYTFDVKIHTITDDTRDPSKFKLVQTEHDPITSFGLDSVSGRAPTANLPRGMTINDLVQFLYAHCEEAQQLMLDVSKAGELHDGESNSINWNGKNYRVPILPYIDADVSVSGYDPVNGVYMKKITYHILSYRTYRTNLEVQQYQKIKDDPTIAVDIVKDLKKRNFLKKRYDYYYTGLNTEVLKFDMNFNFAFQSVLPRVTGWGGNTPSLSHHEKYNPEINGKVSGNNLNSNNNETSAGAPLSLSAASIQLKEAINNLNNDQDTTEKSLEAITTNPQATDPQTKKPYTDAQKKQFADQLAQIKSAKTGLQASVDAVRAADLKSQQERRQQIEAQGITNIFAEDYVYGSTSYEMTYTQSHDEAAQAIGSGFTGQWHRGASLVGALLNQMYQPVYQGLQQIELEIRGDPYWVGQSHFERRAILNGAPRPTNGALPDFGEGDSTFALVMKFPAGVDAQSGEQLFRNDDVFNGLYRTNSVRSTFSGGEFRQVLNATKLELITPLNSNPPTSSSGDNGGTTTDTDQTIAGS